MNPAALSKAFCLLDIDFRRPFGLSLILLFAFAVFFAFAIFNFPFQSLVIVIVTVAGTVIFIGKTSSGGVYSSMTKLTTLPLPLSPIIL